MKKTLTVLLVLAVAMGGLFAISGDNLILKTKVESVSVVGFSSNEITKITDVPEVIADDSTQTADNLATATPKDSVYVYYQSKEQVKPKITVECTPFSSAIVTTKMGYTLMFGTVSLTVLKTENNTATLLNATDKNTQATGQSWKLNSYAVTTADYDDALKADDYQATLTVSLTANT